QLGLLDEIPDQAAAEHVLGQDTGHVGGSDTVVHRRIPAAGRHDREQEAGRLGIHGRAQDVGPLATAAEAALPPELDAGLHVAGADLGHEGSMHRSGVALISALRSSAHDDPVLLRPCLPVAHCPPAAAPLSWSPSPPVGVWVCESARLAYSATFGWVRGSEAT